MRVTDLKADPENRRRHGERNLGMLEASLRAVGAARSIVIDEDDLILAGNGVRAAAEAAGITKLKIIETDGDEIIAVRRRGLTAEQKRALAIFDNRTAELAEWNWEQLAKDREAGLALEPFWTTDEQAAWSVSTSPKTDPDAMPALRPTDIVAGQVFTLGRHRLACGSVEDPAIIAALVEGDGAPLDLIVTSPPYAEQRKQMYGGIPEAQYVAWFLRVQAALRPFLSSVGHFVLNIKPHARDIERSLYVLDLVRAMVRDAKWVFVDEFVWLRTGIPQQVVHRFKNAFEPCYWFANATEYAWFPEAVRHASSSVPIAMGPGAGDTNAARPARRTRGGRRAR